LLLSLIITPAIANNTDIDKQVAEASEALTKASKAVIEAAASLKDAQAKLPAARETMALASAKERSGCCIHHFQPQAQGSGENGRA
jgi:hypothetical protein